MTTFWHRLSKDCDPCDGTRVATNVAFKMSACFYLARRIAEETQDQSAANDYITAAGSSGGPLFSEESRRHPVLTEMFWGAGTWPISSVPLAPRHRKNWRSFTESPRRR
ncbi:MAG: hypothetical protein R3F31_25430 [Verrucomicrobiales bacterium]